MDSKKLSKWTAVFLVGLLIIYYIITLVNTNTIAEQVEMIGEHPYPVAVSVGDVNTGLAQLRSLPERLIYSRTPEVTGTVREHYKAIDSSMTENLDFIMEKYIIHPEDAAALEQLYFDLRKAQNQLLSLCSDSSFTSEATQVFYDENIVPRLDEMVRITDSMIAGSQTKFSEFEQLARKSQLGTIVLSTILMIAVISALLIYLYILRNKSIQEDKMRQVLSEALKSAQNANAAKSQFLFNMSHDIRTPMNAIIGMTAIAGIHINEPAKIKDCLSKITASSKHLLSLINDVLDMSKIENGKIAMNREEFSLPDLFQNFLTIIQPQANAKQLELDIRVSNIERERVIGDTLRINQILLNIVGNAIKFTPSGGKICLQICELSPQYNGYGTYQFTISDTGVGMSADFLEQIFVPFEREHTSTDSGIEGTGLGMAITKNIVDMMNGQISVTSTPGKGTTFVVTLSLKLQKCEEETFDFSQLSELRSLVVDDDADVCENTARLLQEMGMKSEWVLTGAEAVEKVTASQKINQGYHSVIIDWKMPEMDGLETTRRIRSIIGDKIPIIILTAYDWTEIEEEARAAGVNAFLSKPLFKSRLYQVMQDIISGEPSLPAAEAPPAAGNVSEGRILLVEDNSTNMEIAFEFIKGCGCTVEQAWDGSEAVDFFQNKPSGYYNLIFMDIQLPHMDGYEATGQIRRIEKKQCRPHTPIIAMSANAFAEDIEKAYASGMDNYITKPISIEEIQKMLNKYV